MVKHSSTPSCHSMSYLGSTTGQYPWAIIISSVSFHWAYRYNEIIWIIWIKRQRSILNFRSLFREFCSSSLHKWSWNVIKWEIKQIDWMLKKSTLQQFRILDIQYLSIYTRDFVENLWRLSGHEGSRKNNNYKLSEKMRARMNWVDVQIAISESQWDWGNNNIGCYSVFTKNDFFTEWVFDTFFPHNFFRLKSNRLLRINEKFQIAVLSHFTNPQNFIHCTIYRPISLN